MNRDEYRHVTVIGVGLIGGSIGLALKERCAPVRIAGVGRRRESLDAALAAGAIDTAHLDASQCAAESDVVVLATPVGAFAHHLRTLAPVLRPGVLVTDAGSTKSDVVRIAEEVLGSGGPFVGSHPMAGSERKGVEFSRADLYEGAVCIVTPTPRTPADLVERAERFWRTLGMRVIRMGPGEHDIALARVSHLPHLLSAVLMGLPDGADLAVSGPGFRDMTRLAGGDPEMWRDIVLTNRGAIVAALDAFTGRLGELRSLVERGDASEIEAFLAEAKRKRDEALRQTPATATGE